MKNARQEKISVRQQKIKGAQPTLFIILDGFGIANIKNKGNAITPHNAPNIFSYMKDYSNSKLIAHGKDVGLFAGQPGNSEAGHLNIGSGRVVKQDIVMISDAIEDGTFFKNEALHQGILHAKERTSNIHIMGLLTDGHSAHAHPDHMYALLAYCRKHTIKKVFLHLFADGRDSTPHSAIEYLSALRKNMRNGEKIASISGRFYAMDRAKQWDRTEKAYEALVEGKGLIAQSAEEAIMSAYNRGENDEYIQPTIIVERNKPIATIKDNDVIIFFNTRSDRARQLTKALVQNQFNPKNPGSFKRAKVLENLKFIAMTDFGPDLEHVLTAFPSADVENCLAKAIGDRYKQLYISESEKYAHVTYFINGGYPEPINGEHRELLPSTKHHSFVEKPEMRTNDITKKIISYVEKGKYDFIAANFPNADMLGHTGNLEATEKAIRIIDENVQKLVSVFLQKKGRVVIVGDHGNAEKMIDPETGKILTEHSTNPVPFIIIDKNARGGKLKNGRLADIAPTLLELMGIPKPKEMTGKSLLV